MECGAAAPLLRCQTSHVIQIEEQPIARLIALPNELIRESG